MAITITSLTKGTDTDGNSTATTASVTLTANCLVLLRVDSRTGITTNPNQPTATSTGATWVAVNSVVYDTAGSSRKRITVLRTMVASNQTGTIAIDFGGQNQTDVEWSVETTDAMVDTSGTNGSGAVVQSVTATDADGGTATATLAAFGSTNNATYGAFGNDSGTGTMTAGSGFAALGVNAGAVLNGGSEWKATNDTSVDASFDSVVGAVTGVIAIEIKASTASPSASPSVSPSVSVSASPSSSPSPSASKSSSPSASPSPSASISLSPSSSISFSPSASPSPSDAEWIDTDDPTTSWNTGSDVSTTWGDSSESTTTWSDSSESASIWTDDSESTTSWE